MKLYTSSKDAFKNIFNSNDKIIPDSVFDFISLIDNARYVITDSFHGTAFSLSLNTEPICVYPERFEGRIKSILTLTNTLHRHAESYDDVDILDRHVDFAEVNSILDGERKKASDWIRMVFTDIQRHNA